MKTNNVKMLLSAAIVLLMAWAFASCSKDKDNPVVTVDKANLQKALDTANHYLDVAVEGTQAGEYTVGSKTPLQTATTNAQTIATATTSTQSQVDNATTSLTTAITTFKAQLILPIAEGDLIASWKFDEGSGTSTADATGNGHTGTLTAASPASVLTGGVPNYVIDRFGVAGKALHFAAGGHVEVPKSANFFPTEISISVWVKLDSLPTATGKYADNYIVSQNDWHGWKFQTQSVAKPFFTVHTVDGIYDKDTEDGNADPYVASTLYNNRWYHLGVTYVDKTLTFYIDGNLAKQWTGAPSGAMAATPNEGEADSFNIGVVFSNAWYAASAPDGVPGHFEGTMDDLKLFKKALTGTQITGIYNQEKP